VSEEATGAAYFSVPEARAAELLDLLTVLDPHLPAAAPHAIIDPSTPTAVLCGRA
jgi:hypothetical protein